MTVKVTQGHLIIIGSNRLKQPIMEILYGAKTVFARSAITPPKVNRFG